MTLNASVGSSGNNEAIGMGGIILNFLKIATYGCRRVDGDGGIPPELTIIGSHSDVSYLCFTEVYVWNRD